LYADWKRDCCACMYLLLIDEGREAF